MAFNILELLNHFLNNEQVIDELIEAKRLTFDHIEDNLARIIIYFTMTKDENIHQNPIDLIKKFNFGLNFEHFYNEDGSFTTYGKNFIEKGYLTHSFNGGMVEDVKRYGLNFLEFLPQEKRKAYESLWAVIDELENLLDCHSPYSVNEHNEHLDDTDKSYLSILSYNSIAYTMRVSPERLYLGILKSPIFYKNAEVIVGETKKQYMFNYLSKRINDLPNITELKKFELLEKAKHLTNFFCTKKPIIAVYDASKMQDMEAVRNYYLENSPTIRKKIAEIFKTDLESEYFLRIAEETEWLWITNMMVKSSSIPPESLIGYVETLDQFSIMQQIARRCGLKMGEKFNSAEPSKKIGNSTIQSLRYVLPNAKSSEDLDEIYREFMKLNGTLPEPERKKFLNEYNIIKSKINKDKGSSSLGMEI